MVPFILVLLLAVSATTQRIYSDEAAGKTFAQLHVVNQSDFPMAAALDGTPPVYYAKQATGVESTKKWVIYLDGGDFCGYGDTEAEQLQDCYQRSQTNLGSSSTYLKQSHYDIDLYSPLFDTSSRSNPLTHDWNWIFIPYLDGGYYAGNRRDTPIVNGTALYFRGAYNLEAIISSLASEEFFRMATDLVLTGCSSGGVAVIANGDHIHNLLLSKAPHARLSAFADSGYYLKVNTDYWTQPPFKMQHIGRTLNPACLKAKASTPWDCIVGETAALFVEQLHLFLAQSRYDSNQLACVNIDPANVSGVNAYGNQLRAAVTAWAEGEQSSQLQQRLHRNAFVDACSRHCSITPGIATSGGLTPVSVFQAFHSGDTQKLNTSVVVQRGSYPCSTCCGESHEGFL